MGKPKGALAFIALGNTGKSI